MPATTIQMHLYDRMHRHKYPIFDHPNLFSSGPDKENINEWCRIRRVFVRVHGLVKYQVQLKKTFPVFQERSKPGMA